MRSFDVVGIGVAVHDATMQLEAYPAEDTKAPAGAVRDGVGGPVVRAAMVLGRLGRSACVIAAVGRDLSGDAVAAHLRAGGIGHHLLVRSAEPTRRAHVWTAAVTGTRTIVYDEGGPMIPHLTPEAESALDGARAVLFDGREVDVALPAAERGRARGALLTIDLGASEKPGLDDLVARCAVIVGPVASIRRLAGHGDARVAAQRLLERDARLVVATAGANGAHAFDATGAWHQPAFAVDVVDSNGAGDAFHGGLVDALLDDANHREAVRHATAIAALKVAHVGDTGLPDRAGLARFRAITDRTG